MGTWPCSINRVFFWMLPSGLAGGSSLRNRRVLDCCRSCSSDWNSSFLPRQGPYRQLNWNSCQLLCCKSLFLTPTCRTYPWFHTDSHLCKSTTLLYQGSFTRLKLAFWSASLYPRHLLRHRPSYSTRTWRKYAFFRFVFRDLQIWYSYLIFKIPIYNFDLYFLI